MTSTPPPGSKRPHVEDTREKIEAQPDKSIYFEDGNIVISCESTLFRVHRGILSFNSEIFKDMFALGQSESTVDGCPIVELPDKADDIRCYLRSLYDRDYFHQGRHTDPNTVQSLLRTSSKYLAHSLRAQIFGHLRDIYPSTLEEYVSSYEKNMLFFNKYRYHGILAVNMAREFNIPDILPTALLHCTTLTDTAIMNGMQTNSAEPAQLSHKDQVLCLAGRSHVNQEILSANYFIFRANPTWECRDQDQCRENMGFAVGDLGFKPFRLRALVDTPAKILKFIESDTRRVCQSCETEWVKLEEEGHDRFWDKLPSYFHLPSWEALENSTA